MSDVDTERGESLGQQNLNLRLSLQAVEGELKKTLDKADGLESENRRLLDEKERDQHTIATLRKDLIGYAQLKRRDKRLTAFRDAVRAIACENHEGEE